MSTIAQIRDSLRAIVQAVDSQITLYPRIPQKPNLPAAVVVPSEADLMQAMRRGAIEYDFEVFLLTSLRDMDLAQLDLDEYLDLEGPKSIPTAIWNTQQPGGSPPGMVLPDAQARVTGWRDYGGRFEAAGIDHFGARLMVKVLVSRSTS